MRRKISKVIATNLLIVLILLLNQLMTLAQVKSDSRQNAYQLMQEGQNLLIKENYLSALEKFKESLDLYQKSNDDLGKSQVSNNIGLIYAKLGNSSKALEYYQKSLFTYQKIGDQEGESSTLNNIGRIYSRSGDFTQALAYYQKSLLISKNIKDQVGISDTLNNIGISYVNIGELSKAIASYEEAMKIYTELGDEVGKSNILNSLGLSYRILGEYSKALEYYEKSLDVAKKLGNRSAESSFLNNIGVIYDLINQYDKALEYHQKSLKLSREVHNPTGESTSLNNIGVIYAGNKKYSEALEHYLMSLKIYQTIGNRKGEANALNNIGRIYQRLDNVSLSLEHHQKSLIIRKELSDIIGEAESLNNIGESLNLRKQKIPAIIFLKQSVNVYERIRNNIKSLSTEQQKSYIKTVSSTYRNLADLLLQQERILESQQILDLLKIQELEDYLRNRRGTDQPIEFRRSEQEILDRYNELQKNTIQISSELTELRKLDRKNVLTLLQKERLAQLVKVENSINTQFITFIDSPEIKLLTSKLQQNTDRENINLVEIRKIGDKLEKLNAILLYPLILDDRLELVLSLPGSPPLRRTVNVKREELNRTIAEFRSALGNRQGNTQELAEKLYGWLIQPIEADLKQANPKTILYAPDGQLRYIPLAALHDGKQWLVERYRINNITALAISDLLTPPRKDQQILAAAFGNNSVKVAVDRQSFNFDGLPFATKEVQSLAKTHPGTVSLFDRDFTLSTLQTRMNSFNILHLATHGKFLIGNPKKSFLVMGNGDRFSLGDIQESTLNNVDLVVLSACETGVGLTGKDEDGVEVLGIGYQFQRGGAKAAISSLWSINDGGTQKLMEVFYGLLQQGVPKAEALQQAQIALIKGDFTANGKLRSNFIIESIGSTATIETNLKHPFYWAPFILIGNGL